MSEVENLARYFLSLNYVYFPLNISFVLYRILHSTTLIALLFFSYLYTYLYIFSNFNQQSKSLWNTEHHLIIIILVGWYILMWKLLHYPLFFPSKDFNRSYLSIFNFSHNFMRILLLI